MPKVVPGRDSRARKEKRSVNLGSLRCHLDSSRVPLSNTLSNCWESPSVSSVYDPVAITYVLERLACEVTLFNDTNPNLAMVTSTWDELFIFP